MPSQDERMDAQVQRDDDAPATPEYASASATSLLAPSPSTSESELATTSTTTTTLPLTTSSSNTSVASSTSSSRRSSRESSPRAASGDTRASQVTKTTTTTSEERAWPFCLEDSSDSSDSESSDGDDEHAVSKDHRRVRFRNERKAEPKSALATKTTPASGATATRAVAASITIVEAIDKLGKSSKKINDVPTYDGEGDVEPYLIKAKLFVEQFPELDELKRVQLLSTGLKDLAWELYESYIEGDGPKTTEDLFRTLHCMCKKERKWPAKELHSIKQEPNESVNHFGVRVMKLVKKSCAKMSAREEDKNCIGYFERGARPHIQRELKSRHPRTFNKALKIARSADKEGKSSKNKEGVLEYLNNINTTERDFTIPKLEKSSKVEQLSKTVEELQAKLKGLTEKSERPRKEAWKGQHKDKNLTCFHCNVKGHSFARCERASEEQKAAIRVELGRKRKLNHPIDKLYDFLPNSSDNKILTNETVSLGNKESEKTTGTDSEPRSIKGGPLPDEQPMNIRPSSLKRSCANFDKGAHERRRRITFNDFVVILNKDEQKLNHCEFSLSSDLDPETKVISDKCDLALCQAVEVATVQIKMAGLSAEACVDTGAGKNYTSKAMVERILKNDCTRIRLEKCEASVQLADSTSAMCKLKATISINFDGKELDAEFLVLDHLVFDCLIGFQFCKNNNVILDLKDRNVRIGNRESRPVLKSEYTVTIAPYTEQVIAAINMDTTTATYVVDNNCVLTSDSGLVVARGLLDCENRPKRHHVVVANLGDAPAAIQANETLCGLRTICLDDYRITKRVPKDTSLCASMTQPRNKERMFSKKEALGKLGLRLPDLNLEADRFTDEQVCRIVELLLKYEHIFDSKIDAKNGAVGVEHEIDTGNAKPVNVPPHRNSPKERAKIDELTNEMVDKHICSPSNSPWASPVVLIPKKDGTVRFCVDYRRLNQLTVRDVYPLPRIEDCLSALGGNQYFSSLDLASGYWQIQMAEKDKAKTAFITTNGLYEFNVLPFGLTNAPATFQRYMDKVLAGLKWQCLLVYLDDVCVYSKSFDEHLVELEKTFLRMSEYNLKLKQNKCKFFHQEFLYLGHVVSPDGLRTNPLKISAVRDMVAPANTSQLRSFLGLCSYYRRFMRNFAILSSPLNKLIGTNSTFIWTEVEEEAFQKLKQILIAAPMLNFPDYSVPFIVQTDACDDGLGAVLSQVVRLQERVIEYRSRVLQPAEKPWPVREKEALAIIYACETFRPYLYGTKFTIETDHHSLQWLMKAKAPARLVRWALRLSEFDFEIKYKKGSNNGNADGLSRNPINSICNESEFVGVMSFESMLQLVKITIDGENKCNLVASMLCAVENQLKTITKDELINAQRADPNLKHIFEKCENGRQDETDMILSDSLLYLVRKEDGKRLLVIPWNLIEDVLRMYHNEATAVHLSRDRLYDHLQNRFYWYGMYSDVSKWTKGCLTCQSVKPTRPLQHGLLQPIVTVRPFEILGVDILGRFPKTAEGYCYVLVCVDLFTSWVEAAPLRNITAVEVCLTFKRIIIARHGCPEAVLTDQGKQFASEAFRSVCRELSITHLESSAYHHQTNGKVERFNKFIENSLAMLSHPNQDTWGRNLDNTLMSYRMSKNRVTGEKPFYLIYGRDPVLPQDLRVAGVPRNQRTVQAHDVQAYKANLVETLQQSHAAAAQAKSKEQKHYKAYYDHSQKPIAFEVGDRVMLHVPAPKVNVNYKLAPHWEGPYTIEGKVNEVTYRLSLQKLRRMIRTNAHVTRLRRYEEWTNRRAPHSP